MMGHQVSSDRTRSSVACIMPLQDVSAKEVSSTPLLAQSHQLICQPMLHQLLPWSGGVNRDVVIVGMPLCPRLQSSPFQAKGAEAGCMKQPSMSAPGIIHWAIFQPLHTSMPCCELMKTDYYSLPGSLATGLRNSTCKNLHQNLKCIVKKGMACR